MLRAKEKPAAIGVATGKRKRSLETVFDIVTLLVMIVTCIWVMWPEKIVQVEKVYSVRYGETIWHIANDVKSQGDVRQVNEIIWQICEDNGIKDVRNIHAGDKVTVYMQLLEK